MDIQNRLKKVLEEHLQVVDRIDEYEISRAMDRILEADKIFLIGVGREGLATRAFTMRLMHLGLKAHWVWDDTTPALGENDLLIATNGCGNIGHINYVIDKAKEAGSKVLVVTGDPGGLASKKADNVLFIPASVYLGKADVVSSIQPMGNLFEQAAFMIFDSIIMELESIVKISHDEMKLNHRNIE